MKRRPSVPPPVPTWADDPPVPSVPPLLRQPDMAIKLGALWLGLFAAGIASAVVGARTCGLSAAGLPILITCPLVLTAALLVAALTGAPDDVLVTNVVLGVVTFFSFAAIFADARDSAALLGMLTGIPIVAGHGILLAHLHDCREFECREVERREHQRRRLEAERGRPERERAAREAQARGDQEREVRRLEAIAAAEMARVNDAHSDLATLQETLTEREAYIVELEEHIASLAAELEDALAVSIGRESPVLLALPPPEPAPELAHFPLDALPDDWRAWWDEFASTAAGEAPFRALAQERKERVLAAIAQTIPQDDPTRELKLQQRGQDFDDAIEATVRAYWASKTKA